ncbi:MAG: aminopeptidase P N-terminal domain-containing protein, partial [Cytophagales bacterium]|nr:aminopeptidase P N-terminal domain-containing protein [Cytophagales bacterium]
MRYTPINKELFVFNRKRFNEKLKPGSLAVFHSNFIMPTNADGTMGFRQNSDLYYLSGIDQEDTILLLFPDHYKQNNREILFIKETNEHIKIWEGEKLTKAKATELSGIQHVYWAKDFEAVFKSLVIDAEYIYL